VRQKDTYLRAQFYHVKARRGPRKAIIAVAASILTAAYHMLKEGKMYQDLGPNHFLGKDLEAAADQAKGSGDDAARDDSADASLGTLACLRCPFAAAKARAAADAQDLRGGYALWIGKVGLDDHRPTQAGWYT
jgi:hypothetical protein